MIQIELDWFEANYLVRKVLTWLKPNVWLNSVGFWKRIHKHFEAYRHQKFRFRFETVWDHLHSSWNIHGLALIFKQLCCLLTRYRQPNSHSNHTKINWGRQTGSNNCFNLYFNPTFDTKVTEYLCSGWVFFFFRQISTFY